MCACNCRTHQNEYCREITVLYFRKDKLIDSSVCMGSTSIFAKIWNHPSQTRKWSLNVVNDVKSRLPILRTHKWEGMVFHSVDCSPAVAYNHIVLFCRYFVFHANLRPNSFSQHCAARIIVELKLQVRQTMAKG